MGTTVNGREYVVVAISPRGSEPKVLMFKTNDSNGREIVGFDPVGNELIDTSEVTNARRTRKSLFEAVEIVTRVGDARVIRTPLTRK